MAKDKKKKVPFNVLSKKGLMGLAMAGIMIASPFMLAGCSNGQDGKDGKDGVNGPAWHYGVDYTEYNGTINVGDFFIDTNDYILYQKTTDGWDTVMENYGRPGATPQAPSAPVITINQDGYWCVDGTSTGVKAKGEDGQPGATPKVEIKDGFWYINDVKSVKAEAEDGHTPVITINQDGYWVIDDVPTQTKATPSIINIVGGYWYIDGTTTGVKAEGKDGNTWTVGTEYPTTPNNGDMFLNNSTWNVYQYNGTTWAIVGNIKGTDGTTPTINWNFTDDYMSELNSIINSISTIQSNKESRTVEFIAFTDLHKDSVSNNPEFERMIQAMNYLTHNLDIDFVVDLGDNVTTPVKGSNYDVYDQVKEALSSLNAPYINTMGNHDTIPHIYRRDFSTNIENAVFDDVGSWFYFDDQKSAVRYVVLDCQDQGNDANTWTSLETGANVTDRSWKQLDWFANTALKTDKKIIVLEHQSLGSSQSNVIASQSNNSNYFIAKDILQAFMNGQKGSANYTKYFASETTAQDTVKWDFSNQGAGTVLFNLFGHTHGDLAINKNTSISSPFNEISIDNALFNSSTYIGQSATKVNNTVNEISFDVVSVDLLTNTVKTFRFGAGEDRTIQLLDVKGEYVPPVDDDDNDDENSDEVNISSQFTWTVGGPILFADGYAYSENQTGGNPNLQYSNFVNIEGYKYIELTIPARVGTGATGGFAFYTTNNVSGFISEGASERNGNGATEDGVKTMKVEIPAGAKYIRTTYWSSASTHSSTPFNCVLSGEKQKYNITYQTNGYGTQPQSTTDSIIPTELPVLTDTTNTKVFLGWYTNEDLTTEAVAGAAISSDTILYAKWIDKNQTYTITYNINGHGEQPNAVVDTYKLPNELPTLTADGYIFIGWYTDEDLTTEAVAGATISSNTTLYASWLTGENVSSQFSWTSGGPLGYATGKTFEELPAVGTNANLAYSNYISVEGYKYIELTIPARVGTGATGGFAFYTTNDISGFISEGASERNGNGATAEGVKTIIVEIPEGAKYIRTTYWSSASLHLANNPFKCVLYR